MVARIYNKLNPVLEQCVHSITVLEQCSKYSRTLNGEACSCTDLTALNALNFKTIYGKAHTREINKNEPQKYQ